LLITFENQQIDKVSRKRKIRKIDGSYGLSIIYASYSESFFCLLHVFF